jgi:drug/metabolite transporter (DMT)-like permease
VNPAPFQWKSDFEKHGMLQSMSKNQPRSYLFAGLSIMAWSTISTAFKLSLVHLTPTGLLLISSCTATLFLLIYNLLAGVPDLGRIWTNLRQSLLAGMLNPFLYYVVLFTAYDRLRAQEAQALNYTWAIVLAVFGVVMLRERFQLRDFIALLISFIGVLVISTRGKPWSMHFDDIWGSVLAAGSSLIWAWYWILGIKDRRRASIKLFYNFLWGSIVIGVFCLFSRGLLFTETAHIGYGVLGGVYVGLFEMGLTFLLWQKALELTETTAGISNLIFVTPFISLVFIRLILHESIHPATLLGLLMIIGSNVYQKIGRTKVKSTLQKSAVF